MSKAIYLGNIAAKKKADNINFEQVSRNNESFYKIENINAMPSFFMSIVTLDVHFQ